MRWPHGTASRISPKPSKPWGCGSRRWSRPLRTAISTHVATARHASETNGDLGALRAAIGAVFHRIVIRPAEPLWSDNTEWVRRGDEAYWIDPVIKDDGIPRVVEPDGSIILTQRRPKVPLHLEGRSLVAGRGVPE